ncbi:MAG: hypothetical protein ACOYJE_09345 [Bacteroidaceae bacterium]|jgi:hypothetical protein
MLQNLWKWRHVMSSDEDQPVVEDLYVGFDADMRLVVTLEHVDYDEPEYSCSVSAVVDKEEAFVLSKKLGVTMMELPDALGDSVDEYAETANACFRQVQECFKAIVDGLLSEKCPYRLVRKYGKHGFICC